MRIELSNSTIRRHIGNDNQLVSSSMVNMFNQGINLLLKLMLLPVTMFVLAAGLYFYGQFDPVTAGQITVTVFGFIALLWLWIEQTIQKSNIEKLRQGIHDHEASLVKRINSISANVARSKDVERIQRQVELIQKITGGTTLSKASHVIEAHDAMIEPTKNNEKMHLDSGIDEIKDSKIISLDTAKRSLQNSPSAATIHHEPEVFYNLIVEGNICIYLQPKVILLDNSVYGFEVLARLKDHNNHLIPACQFMNAITKPGILHQIDAEVLDQTISLMRSLKRQGQQQIMHVNISSESFSNDEAFKKLLKRLTSNKSLKNFLILEMSEKDFNKTIKKYADGLNQIMQIGFRFCVDNCQDADNAVKFMKSGMLSSVKINANAFQEIDYWTTIDNETNLSSQAKETGVRLIATHVERKRQVIQLIDNNVEIAQGFLFSEPKPPANGHKSSKSGLEQNKAAQN